jgi:hypothetical protein
VRKPGFQVKVKRAKNGLKEQEEKCRNADFLHEVELLSKHNTKVAAATQSIGRKLSPVHGRVSNMVLVIS